MVVLDTNILIDHLRQSRKGTAFEKIAEKFTKKSLALSVISIQELYEGESTKEIQQEKDLIYLVNSVKILPFTYEIAVLAGKLSRDSKKPLEFADAAIAATAIINGAQLYTLNQKDFRGIDELELFQI